MNQPTLLMVHGLVGSLHYFVVPEKGTCGVVG